MNLETARQILTLTQKSYNDIAPLFSATRRNLWLEFKDFLPYIKKDMKVLDVGCGNGRLVSLFKDNPVSYLGIDPVSAFIYLAQQQYPRYKFLVQNVLSLDLPENSFDLVFSIAVLSHVPGKILQMQALKNMYQVLKPNGYLLMTVWNLWTPFLKNKNIYHFLSQRLFLNNKKFLVKYGFKKADLDLQDILTIWKKNDIQATLYYHAFRLGELKNLVCGAGFKIEKIYYSHGFWQTGNLVLIAKK